MNTKKVKREVLLKGEGTHQHVLQGDFQRAENSTIIEVVDNCTLRHEKPDGSPSLEHKTLLVIKGKWSQDKQVEYNPIINGLSDVWD